MGLRINQNIAAMNAYRNLSVTDGQMAKSLERLSSGFRINRAADDAAGLSISEGLRAQVGGLKVAVRNAQDGISVVQTAEGALSETHSILQRMRDLAVQSSTTGAQDTSARAAAQEEYDQLQTELDRIADATVFGSTKLLDGSYGSRYETATLTTSLATFNGSADGLSAFTVGNGTWTTGNIVMNDATDLNSDGTIDHKDIQQQLTTDIDAALTAIGRTAGEVKASVTDNDGDGTYQVQFTSAAAFTVTESVAGGLNALGTAAASISGTNNSPAAVSAAPANLPAATVGGDAFLLKVDDNQYITVTLAGADANYDTAAEAVASLQTDINTALTGAGLAAGLVTVTSSGADAAAVLTFTRSGAGASDADASVTLAIAPGSTGLTELGFTNGVTDTTEVNEGGVFQVGANNSGVDQINVTINDMSTGGELSVLATNNVSAKILAGDATAIDDLDEAISNVSTVRSNLGALQNRFEHTIANLTVTQENLAASESRIRDTDMALEMVAFTRSQILSQAGTSMLAQANQAPQSVLSLLRG